MRLDLADPVALTRALVDVPSVSGDEARLADLVADALDAAGLTVDRAGNNLVARTRLGRGRRVLLAGHLDTVPIAGNVPSHDENGRIHGCGTSDMKSGLAVLLHLAATIAEPSSDLTVIAYDCEEVEADRNGLAGIARDHRDWLDADLAILMEPTNGAVEAGCQGTLRVRVEGRGHRAHSARSWLGDNAIHHLAAPLAALCAYAPREVTIDGCTYREGLNAVGIAGGVAGNVVPDEAEVLVNFRFAPDRTIDAAYEHVVEVLGPCTLLDAAAGALPRLDEPAAAEFVAATGSTPVAKYGWTDVSRFAALGIPALNYGPGDPNLAHTREESVETATITACADLLRAYLTA
ncbi:MAG TPA: succinyl-diaminopimelate desuccinylase [Mycobacteriales bacterium]